MHFPPRLLGTVLLLGFLPAAGAPPGAGAPPAPTPAATGPLAPPAHDWVLPLFTKEGYRQMTIKGDEVQPITADQIDMKMMNVTVFTGGAEPRVDSVILSPTAIFMINEKTARGEQAVRVIRDDMEVTGVGWNYDYNAKKVLIFHHVHVVFHSALPDILK